MLNFKFRIVSQFKTLFIAILLIITTSVSQGQKKYISPVDFPLLLAGNVGELRTNAFHAGIDIKGMSGLGSPVFAIADGYVWRIGVSAWGYGNVLYLKHNDGAVSVVAHLHEFTPKIAKWVRDQQYAKQSFTVDLYPSPSLFRFKQGEQIATVGNTGSSGGAHVHLEVRDPATAQPMNILQLGLFQVPDSEKPIVKSIKIIEIDTIMGVAVHRLKTSLPYSEGMQLTLRDRGYLVYEIVDYKDGRTNTMGIYSINQRIDGATNYSFKIDRLDLTKGRYINTHIHYAEHRGSKWDVIRAYVSAHNQLDIYQNVKNQGIITATDKTQEVVTDFLDDAGNLTTIRFSINKDKTTPSSTTYPADGRKIVRWREKSTYYGEGFAVSIPETALYDDAILTFRKENGDYIIGSEEIPLHRSIWFTAITPQGVDYSKLGLVRVDGNDLKFWIGGKQSKSGFTATTIRFGRYRLMEDKTPPIITSINSVSWLLGFKITDDLSGVADYRLTIDGKWELAEFDGKTATLSHRKQRGSTPRNREVVLVVTDRCQNKTTYKQNVRW